MSTNYSPTIVTDGIVEAWDPLVPSTNTSATLLYDRVGSTNGTMYTGGCLDFDGSNDYVVADYSSNLDITGNFTQVAWVKIDTNSTYNSIISWGEHATSKDRTMWIQSGTGKLSLYFYDTSVNMAIGTSDLDDGAWHFCVATWDGTYGNIYVDGAFEDRKALTALSYTYTNTSIGRNVANSYFFDGQIADAKIFDVALSLSQIKELYNDSKVIVPSNVSQTNLKLWCPLVDGAGLVAYDGSGYGNHGALTNMVTGDWLTGQTGAPQLVGGFNRAMLFDGSDDWVDCGSSPITSNSAFSWAAWINPTGSSGTPFFLGTNTTGQAMVSYWDSSTNIVRVGWWGGDKLISTIAIPVNSWGHTCWTWDGTTLRAYTNGVAAGTATGFTFNIASDDMIIGAASASAQEFEGLINEVIVYDTALTLAQVQALAATGPNGGPLPPDAMSLSNSSDIVAYWRNDGAIAYNGSRRWTDLSGNGHTGAVVGTDSLIFKQGVNGNANVNTGRDNQGFPLLCKDVGATGYNGTSYYINLGNSAGQIAGLGSLDAWVYPTADKWMYFFIKGYGSANSLFLGGHTNAFGSGKWGWFFGSYDGGYNYHYWGTAGGFEADYANRWHYLAMTFNKSLASANWKVYWNGEYNSADNWTSDLGTGTPSALIGGSRYWSGQIGPIRTYNRVLSPDEIQQNYKAQRSRFT
jgi:hypothetical protein